MWITASETSGYVGALDEQTITFTVSPYINIGDFDEVIYLVGENEMSEPLPVSIKVRGTAPEWALDDALLESNQSMHIVARVEIYGNIMNDPADKLAVFGNNHELLGVASMKAETALAYLTVYNHDRSATPLHYEYYDASTGIIHVLVANDERTDTFQPDAIIGTAANPTSFETNNVVVQTFQLKKGWNWLSLYIEPIGNTVSQLLNNATRWEVGDGLEAQKEDGSYAMLNYKAVYNSDDSTAPLTIWDSGDSIVTLNPQQMYRFYSMSDKVAYLTGIDIIMPITVQHGWNRLGYISQLNLPLGTALADYTDQASEGDIIKSQSEFAVLTVDAQGNKQWQGTLEHMRAGQGYMLMRSAPDQVQFRYPTYYGQSRYASMARTMNSPLYENRSSSSMTVVAVTDGISVEEGETLTAWRGAQCCGVAVADADGMFFLNVGGVTDGADEANTGLTFTIERDAELLATAGNPQLRYVPNATHGTPKQPITLNFNRSTQYDSDGWYDLSGRKVANRKLPAGVYIHNNKKVIIK